MNTTPSVAGPRWPLIIALGVFALVRPGVRIVAAQLDVDLPALVPIALMLLITVVWVAAVGLTDTAQPVLTLVTVGLVYMAASLVLSGALTPILDSRLAGPLAEPVAIAPFMLVNVAWGLFSGVLALAVQRVRRGQSTATTSSCTAPSSARNLAIRTAASGDTSRSSG